MRATVISLAAFCGLTLLSASANAGLGLAQRPPADPAITLVEGGCGPAFHRRNWVDAYGRPRSECVPNVVAPVPVPVPVRRCAPGWHWREWRGPYGHLHAECVPNR
jgi:hypothetical protein